jgi:hypothetical protein
MSEVLSWDNPIRLKNEAAALRNMQSFAEGELVYSPNPEEMLRTLVDAHDRVSGFIVPAFEGIMRRTIYDVKFHGDKENGDFSEVDSEYNEALKDWLTINSTDPEACREGFIYADSPVDSGFVRSMLEIFEGETNIQAGLCESISNEYIYSLKIGPSYTSARFTRYPQPSLMLRRPEKTLVTNPLGIEFREDQLLAGQSAVLQDSGPAGLLLHHMHHCLRMVWNSVHLDPVEYQP